MIWHLIRGESKRSGKMPRHPRKKNCRGGAVKIECKTVTGQEGESWRKGYAQGTSSRGDQFVGRTFLGIGADLGDGPKPQKG